MRLELFLCKNSWLGINYFFKRKTCVIACLNLETLTDEEIESLDWDFFFYILCHIHMSCVCILKKKRERERDMMCDSMGLSGGEIFGSLVVFSCIIYKSIDATAFLLLCTAQVGEFYQQRQRVLTFRSRAWTTWWKRSPSRVITAQFRCPAITTTIFYT